jgi:hypothetical protein
MIRYSPRHRGNAPVIVGPPPGWCTKTHRRYISKDRQLLKAIEKTCQSSDQDSASYQMRFSTYSKIVHRDTGIIGPKKTFLFAHERHASSSEQVSQYTDTLADGMYHCFRFSTPKAFQLCRLFFFSEGEWIATAV